MTRSAVPEADDVADTAQQLAVLLGAGIAPATAWAHLARVGQAQVRQTPMGQAPMGQAPMGQAPMGWTQTGQAQRGQDQVGQAQAARAFPRATQAAWASPRRVHAVRGSAGGPARRARGIAARLWPARRPPTPADAVAAAAAQAARAGQDVARAVTDATAGDGAARRDAWAALAALWHVAEVSGAPPAASLRALAGALREMGRVRRQAGTALAGPAATARLVLVLPGLAVLLGAALGFDTVRVLVTTLPGIVCAVAAGLLVAAAARWNRRLVHSAAPRERAPGLALELLAVAMSGGVSIGRARDLVAAGLPSHLAASSAELAAAGEVFALAGSAGVPAAELLRSAAAARRAAAVVSAERAAVALAVRLMLPLGLCVLPAFMLVGVLPLLFSILSATIGGLS